MALTCELNTKDIELIQEVVIETQDFPELQMDAIPVINHVLDQNIDHRTYWTEELNIKELQEDNEVFFNKTDQFEEIGTINTENSPISDELNFIMKRPEQDESMRKLMVDHTKRTAHPTAQRTARPRLKPRH